MPRRRLLDPSFTDDIEVAKLTWVERLFLIGCLRNSDDEGRLLANIAYLKSEIFMHDEDIDLQRMKEIKESTLEKMKTWRHDNVWCLFPYRNSEQDYLCFPNWYDFNKPSHPTASKLPTPPAIESPSGTSPVTLSTTSGQTQEVDPSNSALSQVKSSQVRLSKVREVQEDFKIFIDREKDLTDFLMTTLEKYVSAGRAQALASGGGLGEAAPGELAPDTEAAVKMNFGIQVLEKCWEDGVGSKMPQTIFDGARKALKGYPLEVLAKAFAKGVKYKGGKHKSWKYIQAIIDEEMAKSEN